MCERFLSQDRDVKILVHVFFSPIKNYVHNVNLTIVLQGTKNVKMLFQSVILVVGLYDQWFSSRCLN